MRFFQEYRSRIGKDVWCYDGRINKRRVADSGFASKEEAEDAVAALRVKARNEKYGFKSPAGAVTLSQLVEERAHDFDKSKKNHRRAMNILRAFAARFPTGYTVGELTAVDLREYVKIRKREFAAEMEKAKKPRAMSPETVNRDLGFISGMLRAAPKMFTELENYRPPAIPWEKVSKRKRKRPITFDEEGRLLKALRAAQLPGENPQTLRARHDVADLFELTLNTGMRGGEAVKITRPQVDFDSGEIDLGKTKNGESRRVPMNSRVIEILSRRLENSDSFFVFPNPKGDGHRYDYSKTFRRVAKELGLTYGQGVDNGFTMHATRHTATTRMLRAGNDVSSVQEIIGHSDRTMTLVYSHASAETRRKAVQSLVR
jgi:integrase